MKQSDLRTLIHNASKQPVRLCMDDGKVYTIKHENLALAAPSAVLLASGPGHDFGASFVICQFEHITRVEVLDKPKQNSGKG